MTAARSYPNARPRGYADWNPHKKTRELLETIRGVLAEYREHLPMTNRQVFYRLVALHNFPKDENAYGRLLEYMNRGRRAGLIEWDAIRDDGVTVRAPGGFCGKAGFWEAAKWTAENYRRRLLDSQAVHLELWVEAGGMVPQIERVATEYGVTVYSSGGFESVTAKRGAALRLVKHLEAGKSEAVVLNVGDHDPSGLSIFDAAAEDINAFIEAEGWATDEVACFRRVAVTPEQIERFDLPEAPPKKTDRRGDWQGGTVQCEALDPATLAAEIRAALEAELDLEALAELRATEARERVELVDEVRAALERLEDGA